MSLKSCDIKAEAFRLGFSACGLAPAEAVDERNATAFRHWLASGYQADMTYMQNYEEKRLDPRLLVEGARTVVSVALNYYPAQAITEEEYQIAWYAYGKDYHDVMKAKLHALLEFVQRHFVPKGNLLNGRAFCDTAPVLDRYWAWRAGLGWIGKNTQLILPRAGSSFFLGELIVDLPADHYDTPQRSRCGSCTRCLEACPTQAIETPYRVNAHRCLSYLTIEHRGAFPPEAPHSLLGNKIYGCDDCQRACPWTRFATPTTVPEFTPSPALLQMKREEWHRLTEEQYKALFKGSAVKRAKYEGLKRNIDATSTP
ncbi:MAG: tRNA epoxyqueuosine(34) reductase QueG [Mediterranea sp.]|nr:tRNA epoxyqueuosine(34) reductase QueG [Mediterranea sp.]